MRQRHGKPVETLRRKLSYLGNSQYKYAVLNYNIWRNGDLVTVEHYSTVILTIDTVTKELVYAGGISPSDSDAINTVIAHYDIVNYRGRECFPYASYSKTNSKVYVSTES